MVLSMLGCTFPVVQPGTATAIAVSLIPRITETVLIRDMSLTPPTSTNTATATDTPTFTPTATPTFTPTDTPTPLPTETLVPTLDSPYSNQSRVLSGLCFAYLDTLVGRTLRFDSDADLRDFYNEVDQSEKCIELVRRETFDFASQQLVGTVISGQGCGIILTYQNTEEDADTRTINIQATITGDCPYRLLQPLVLAVDRSDKRTRLSISQ